MENPVLLLLAILEEGTAAQEKKKNRRRMATDDWAWAYQVCLFQFRHAHTFSMYSSSIMYTAAFCADVLRVLFVFMT